MTLPSPGRTRARLRCLQHLVITIPPQQDDDSSVCRAAGACALWWPQESVTTVSRGCCWCYHRYFGASTLWSNNGFCCFYPSSAAVCSHTACLRSLLPSRALLRAGRCTPLQPLYLLAMQESAAVPLCTFSPQRVLQAARNSSSMQQSAHVIWAALVSMRKLKLIPGHRGAAHSLTSRRNRSCCRTCIALHLVPMWSFDLLLSKGFCDFKVKWCSG